MLNKISLRETSQLSEAEILLRDIPHDNSAGHLPLILEKISKGIAKAFQIEKDGKNIGLCITEKHEKDFVVLAMIVSAQTDIFKTVHPIITKIALQNGCNNLVFWTVRAGLIQKALENDFKISHVEMRKNIA